MNKNKLTLLAVASLMILAGCDSKEQHREAARKANEEWAQNAKDYQVTEYGKGKVLFPSHSEEKKK
uniref:Putative lipoprotein n=1 Tax=Ralstonia solanacearum PSI07 TaxID=859657 RepID=D8MYC7_RALSL|nr:hypothetical protein [Ralstonia solanacearum]CBJ34343.1 Putative lipoprotein [Ralstonia solanacearum PSI07]